MMIFKCDFTHFVPVAKRLLLSGILLSVWMFGFAVVCKAEQRNLALHTRLHYKPDPDYRYPRHDNDPYILTDGVTDAPLYRRRYRWSAKEYAVGWYTSDIVEIKIDLGQAYSVDAVHVHTFCGRNNGIEFPEYIVAASSMDGKRYRFAGCTATDGWEFSPAESVLRVVRVPVRQHARYITLYVRPFNEFFLATEIEVLQAQKNDAQTNQAGYLTRDKMLSCVERLRQLQRDSHALKPRIGHCGKAQSGLLEEWKKVSGLITGLHTHLTDARLAQAEQRLAQLRATWFRVSCDAPWLIYPADPMDVLRQGDVPADVPEHAEVSLYQWQDEYGAATLNLVNSSETTIHFSAHFSPLRLDEKTVDSKDIFELRRGLYVWVPQAGLVTDPLVLQNATSFPVAPGQTVQLWIDVHAKKLAPGMYTAELSLEARGQDLEKRRHVVPIQLEIADRQFPEKMPFYTCNWDYVRRRDRFTAQNPRLATDDLRRHYINVVPVTPKALFANNAWSPGKFRFSPDKLRAELQVRGMMGIPHGKNSSFLLLMTGGSSQHELRFGKYGTPGFENRYSAFLRAVIRFMLSNGYDYDSFALYPFDERLGWDFMYVAKIIRKVDPKVRIFANRWPGLDAVKIDGQIKKVSRDTHFEMIRALVDIWCPHLMSHILHNPLRKDASAVNDFKGFRDMLLSEGKQVWSYHANIARQRFYYPEKILASKDYRGANRTAFRTMPIVAAALGMTGMGFWTYISSGEDLWQLKAGQPGHSVVYDGSKNPDAHAVPEFIIPSKRWRQWRLGVQDAVVLMEHEVLLDEFYTKPGAQITSEYLTTLRRRADTVK